MNEHHPPSGDVESHRTESMNHNARSGHGWMMLVCCIPMLVIAVVLVAIDVVSASFILFAIACLVIMGFMMRGMDHGGGH